MIIEDFHRKSEEDILRVEDKCIPLLKFKKLSDTGIVEHCFTTRQGGCSQGIFSSLNLSFTRGDSRECVEENYRRLADALEVRPENFVTTDQTHTTNVIKVGREDMGFGVTRPRPYTDVDGLVTDEAGVVLSTFYADCVPLYFVDTKNRAIGMSHSGWRGTVGRIGKATLVKMQQEFGTRPQDVVAAIGPSICQDCYEVSHDVADAFMEEFKGHQKEILLDNGNGKYQLDLWQANRIVLMEAGVKAENIAVTNICTCCNPGLLFSHRASRGKRGNLGGFIYLSQR